MIRHQFEHAQWEVMWVHPKRGIIAVDFDDELFEAMRLYTKAVQAGKRMVTLRCKNMGTPVPFRYMGKMQKYNDLGVWWCPYCITLRRFEKRAGFETEDGRWVDHVHYACPMCDVMHTNAHVIKANPLAARIFRSRKSRRGGRKKRKK